jgi:hypothetical protein
MDPAAPRVGRGLRLGPSLALKERRLHGLLAGRSPEEPALRQAVRDAQLLGSLELAGRPFSWDQVRGQGMAVPGEVEALRRAQGLAPDRAFSVDALRAWHAAARGGGSFREAEAPASAEGPAPAPARFVASRLAALEEWLSGPSGRELAPASAAALVLARLVEIRPFDDGNGRVSRLAASHVMVSGGQRPPILVGGDRPRLEDGLRAAFRLETEPLARLLQEAAERAVDVLIQSLQSGV